MYVHFVAIFKLCWRGLGFQKVIIIHDRTHSYECLHTREFATTRALLFMANMVNSPPDWKWVYMAFCHHLIYSQSLTEFDVGRRRVVGVLVHAAGRVDDDVSITVSLKRTRPPGFEDIDLVPKPGADHVGATFVDGAPGALFLARRRVRHCAFDKLLEVFLMV